MNNLIANNSLITQKNIKSEFEVYLDVEEATLSNFVNEEDFENREDYIRSKKGYFNQLNRRFNRVYPSKLIYFIQEQNIIMQRTFVNYKMIRDVFFYDSNFSKDFPIPDKYYPYIVKEKNIIIQKKIDRRKRSIKKIFKKYKHLNLKNGELVFSKEDRKDLLKFRNDIKFFESFEDIEKMIFNSKIIPFIQNKLEVDENFKFNNDILRFFIELTSKNGISFDDYIDDWSKELINNIY